MLSLPTSFLLLHCLLFTTEPLPLHPRLTALDEFVSHWGETGISETNQRADPPVEPANPLKQEAARWQSANTYTTVIRENNLQPADKALHKLGRFVQIWKKKKIRKDSAKRDECLTNVEKRLLSTFAVVALLSLMIKKIIIIKTDMQILNKQTDWFKNYCCLILFMCL